MDLPSASKRSIDAFETKGLSTAELVLNGFERRSKRICRRKSGAGLTTGNSATTKPSAKVSTRGESTALSKEGSRSTTKPRARARMMPLAKPSGKSSARSPDKRSAKSSAKSSISQTRTSAKSPAKASKKHLAMTSTASAKDETALDVVQQPVTCQPVVHIARFLSDETEGEASKAAIIEHINSAITSEISGSASRVVIQYNSDSDHLIRRGPELLPTELLDMIGDELEPADVISLALASRVLFARLDYHLADLKVCQQAVSGVEAAARGEVLDDELDFSSEGELFDHRLDHDLHVQRFVLTQRLDRDTIQALADRESEAMLTCSVCRTHHAAWLFTTLQRKSPATKRLCRAALTKITLCEEDGAMCRGSSISFTQHRADRREFISWQLKRVGLGCVGHGPDRGPTMTVGPDHTLIEWRRPVGFLLGMSRNFAELTFSDPVYRTVCKHLTVKVEDMFQALKRLEAGLPSRDQKCTTCGTGWTFSWAHKHMAWMRQDYGTEHEELDLVMRIVTNVKRVDDPWSDEWLKHVEGGMKLKEKVRKVTAGETFIATDIGCWTRSKFYRGQTARSPE